MEMRLLGATGLRVSAISLGTAGLAQAYAAPGQSTSAPTKDDAIALIQHATEAGINLIDTAPAYGDAERLIGESLRANPVPLVMTKLSSASLNVLLAIEESAHRMSRKSIDVLQLHNATPQLLSNPRIFVALSIAKERGFARHIGASVYGEQAALAVLECPIFEVLQVALNVLDQRMLKTVIPAAQARGVGIIARSALLKGVLSPKALTLPPSLSRLKEAAINACDRLHCGSLDMLPVWATAWCLSQLGVSSVLVGPQTEIELNEALNAERIGPLDAETLDDARDLALADEHLLDPSTWPLS